MRRTRVVHVQSGDADTWAGWEADQIIDFIARHTGIRTQAKKPEKQLNIPAPEEVVCKIHDESIPTIDHTLASLPLMPSVSGMSKSSPEITDSSLKLAVTNNFTGILHLRDFEILAVGSNTPVYTLHQGQPCHMRITLDLTNVVVLSDIPLAYKAMINLKQLGGASCLVAEESNTIKPSDCVTLDMICTSPPPGLYRPEAIVKLFSDRTTLGLMASLKGDLIQVL